MEIKKPDRDRDGDISVAVRAAASGVIIGSDSGDQIVLFRVEALLLICAPCASPLPHHHYHQAQHPHYIHVFLITTERFFHPLSNHNKDHPPRTSASYAKELNAHFANCVVLRFYAL